MNTSRHLWLVPAAALLVAPPARAHHEAIFGPQSSSMISAPAFVSGQAFSRQTGTTTSRTQETTGLVSGGISPVKTIPLAFLFIAPVTHTVELDGAANRFGAEDVLVGARYRLDLNRVQRAMGREGNFALAMASVELPTGNVDHPAFDGPLDYMFAGLYSLEWRQISTIAYGFYRLNGMDSASSKKGDNVFLGGGVAYTPLDDRESERLLSFQLGVSHETYFKDIVAGTTNENSGGWELLVHPTVVWGPGGRVLLFAMASIPVVRDFRDQSQQDRWRAGAGIIYLLGL